MKDPLLPFGLKRWVADYVGYLKADPPDPPLCAVRTERNFVSS